MEHQLTPLQQKVLERYGDLAACLKDLDLSIKELNAQQQNVDSNNKTPDEILKEMREIEMKIGLIGTLLKGSVYTLYLQKQQEKK